MGRLHVKFHEDRCKGEAVMRLKPFYLTAQSLHCDLDLWPCDPKVHRAHTWLMGRLHVKFHEDRCKGEAFMRLKPFYLTARLQTDGQTDGRTGWFQYTPPPNFVAGGIKKEEEGGEKTEGCGSSFPSREVWFKSTFQTIIYRYIQVYFR